MLIKSFVLTYLSSKKPDTFFIPFHLFPYNSHKYFSFVGYKTLQLFITYGIGILVIAT